MDDSSDLQLDLALRLDALAEDFAARRVGDPGLTAETFAAEHPDVPAAALLPVLRGIGLLRRSSDHHLGPFEPGDRVGPYEIRGTIGRGGMGIVYDAVEAGLDRHVALKALHRVDLDDRTRARFEREARAAASLDHGAIVPVLGSGETGGVLWYAMRRVDGQALDQVMASLAKDQPEPIRRQALSQLEGSASNASRSGSSIGAARLPLRARAAVLIVHRLAGALAYAHERGILHRDIKPANVLLDRSGEPSLTDFGLCKIEGDQSLTQDGAIVGTLRYMPPEALDGRFDERGDVYSLALVLYELSTGRTAFTGDSRQSILHEVLHVDPPALRKVAPEAPEDLERILRKALAKLPEERYRTAAAFAEDLQALLAGKPVRARKPSPFYLLGLFVRRNRALAATLAAAALTLVLGTALYVVSLQGAYGEVSDALALAERSGAQARLAASEATLRTEDVAAARAQLAQIGEEHRGWMWNHLAARVGDRVQPLPVDIKDLEGMVVTPDGQRLAIFGWQGIEVRERRGLERVGVIERGVVDADFVEGGDGLLVLERSPRTLQRLEFPGGEVTIEHRLSARAAKVRALAGTDIALVLEGYNTLVALNWRTGEELWRQRIPVPRIQVFEPLSESEFVFGTTGGQVLRANAAGGAAESVSGHLGRATALLVEDAVPLASGGSDGTLELLPALTGAGRLRVKLEGEITCIARSAEEPHQLAVGLANRTVALVDARYGVAITCAAGLDTAPRGVDLGSDPWLVTLGTGNVLTRWDRDQHDGRIELPPAVGNLLDVGASPDGRWVAAMAADGHVWLTDLISGAVAALPTSLPGTDDRPDFAPDGASFAVGPEIRSLPEGELVATLEGQGPHHSTFGPEGRLSVIESVPGGLQRWRLDPSGEARYQEIGLLEMEGFRGREDALVRLVAGSTGLFAATRSGHLLRLDGQGLGLTWHEDLGEELRDIAVDPASRELLVANVSGQVHVHDAATGERLPGRSWRVSPAFSRKSTVASLVLGPAAGLATTCSMDGRVVVWDRRTARRVGSLMEVGSEVRHLAMVGDTGWLVAGGGFGRTVLLGHGDAPAAPGALARGGIDIGTVVERSLAARGPTVPLRRAIQSSRRLRPGPWRDELLKRLSKR